MIGLWIKAHLVELIAVVLVAAVLGATLWTTYSKGARSQAPKVATAQAQATIATAGETLADHQLANSSQLQATHAKATERTSSHVAAVQAAPDVDAAFAEYLRGLRDDRSAQVAMDSVPRGSEPADAPR